MIIATPERRKFLFNEVRDIPYSIDFQGAEGVSCFDKAVKLKTALEQEGISSKVRGCVFRWGDQSLPTAGLPPSVLNGYKAHFYLEVHVPETETPARVDPTWDAGLQRAGFPLLEWDGITSMPRIAVLPHCYLYDDVQNDLAVEQRANALLISRRMDQPDFREACAAINAWIKTCRAATERLAIKPPASRYFKDCHA